MSNLVVIGQGYVGLPMALRAVEVGHSVVGLDLNETLVSELNMGRSHIDDVSAIELRKGLDAGYRATTDAAAIADADVVVVCVPTPLSDDGGPDLGAVIATGHAIGEYVNPGTLCILESTTYPGTTEEVFAPLVTRSGLQVGNNVYIAFSPERIDPGNRSFNVRNTPKVVGGITEECAKHAYEFYASFIDDVVKAKGAKEAEMAKLLENTFRHVNIALVNEMVRFCRELDIDLWDAIDAAATKPFGFMPFRPGPGVGGHCIPIDPSYLSHRVKAKLGYAFRMVELAEEINHAAPAYVCERVRGMLNDGKKSVNGAHILLLGVTYKPDISDVRESPAVPIARTLLDLGAVVSYCDPHVEGWNPSENSLKGVVEVTDPVAAASSSDIVVLLQDHAVLPMAEIAASSRAFLDTRAAIATASNVTRL